MGQNDTEKEYLFEPQIISSLSTLVKAKNRVRKQVY